MLASVASVMVVARLAGQSCKAILDWSSEQPPRGSNRVVNVS